MLRYLTAGESHGPRLTAIIEGLPAGLSIDRDLMQLRLRERQGGYGRGGRMKIEQDHAQFTSGVRDGKALGSPVTLTVENKDWRNWESVMAPFDGDARKMAQKSVSRPRPGHADLTGAMKYGHADMRNVLERASARETAMRVAVGTVAEMLLNEFGIELYSYVVSLGGIAAKLDGMTLKQIDRAIKKSDVRCADEQASKKMIAAIDKAKRDGDTLGGIVENVAVGVPPGLGSHVQWDRKLDARIAAAMMSVQAVKCVEIGLGKDAALRRGSEVHDEITFSKAKRAKGEHGFGRRTNNMGGFEGSMTTGEPVVVRVAMKPIATLMSPLRSVDMNTKRTIRAAIERSDYCVAPALSVVTRAALAFELARAFCEKFGQDTVADMHAALEAYRKRLRTM